MGSHLPSPAKSDASRAFAALRIADVASSAVNIEEGEGGEEELGEDEDEDDDNEEEEEEVMAVSAPRITSLGEEGVGVSGLGNMAAAAAEGSKPVWQALQSVA